MDQNETLYDPLQADDYVNHLGLLGIQHVLTASEDICNQHGVLLVKKGTQIQCHTANKLYKHRLSKPLDEVIRISECFSNAKLLDATKAMLSQHPDMQRIHEASNFETRLTQLFTFRSLPLALQQKLTVMSETLPDSFEKALFCSWLAPLIAEKMQLKPSQVYNAFLVGLLHDVGLVHFPLETATKTRNYTSNEWRTLCLHTAVSRLILQQHSFEKPVLIAVQNHHEYCDGTGYPTRKGMDDLNILSRIIAFCDLLYVMRMRQFEPVGKNLADAMPLLRVNNQTFSFEVHTAVVEIFRNSGLKISGVDLKNAHETIPAQLVEGGRQLQDLLKILHSLLVLPDVQVLEVIYEQAYASLHTSGLGSEQLESWLTSLTIEETKNATQELQELKGFLDGVHWIFKRACRLLPLLASSAKSEENANQLLDAYQKIENYRRQWEANWAQAETL